jgi:hypothetical protein
MKVTFCWVFPTFGLCGSSIIAILTPAAVKEKFPTHPQAQKSKGCK